MFVYMRYFFVSPFLVEHVAQERSSLFIDVSSVAGALSYNRNNNLRKPRKESKYCDRRRHRGRPSVSRES
jgi:hypothetical protein